MKSQYPEFLTLISNYDIVCLVETKTDDCDSLELKGFVTVMKNRAKFMRVKSGGITLAIKNYLADYVKVIDTESRFVLWFKLDKKVLDTDKDLLFGIVYIPPENSIYNTGDPYSELENEFLSLREKNKCICLIGDFNARTACDPDYIDVTEEKDLFSEIFENNSSVFDETNVAKTRKSSDKKKNNFGYQLLDFCRFNKALICNGRVGDDCNSGKLTCKNASVVDYAVGTPQFINLLEHFSVLEFNSLFSDAHSPLSLSLKCKVNTEISVDLRHVEQIEKIKKWDNSKKDEYVGNICNDKINGILNQLNSLDQNFDINEIVNEVCSLLTEAAKKALGTYYQRSHNISTVKESKQWFNNECKIARKLYRRMNGKYQRNKTDENLNNVKRLEKEYKRVLDKSIKEHRKNLKNKLADLRSSNPKDYWKILNCREKKNKVHVSMDDLHDFFKELNSDHTSDNTIDHFDLENNTSNDTINGIITKEEIEKAISKLKNNKSSSDDEITNEFIKHSTCKMLDVYVKLFNAIFDTGKVPDTWLTGNIIPLYKNKGSVNDPKNYRPITLVSCFGKLFTAVLNNRLNKLSDEISLMGEIQAGFRKGYSTLDNVFVLHMLMNLLRKQRKKLHCVFIDFEKAFDKVWRDALWYKMILNQIDGKMYNTIYNMY